MKPFVKQILRRQLDKSLTQLNSSVIYINKMKYKIFRGRIIAITEPNGKVVANIEYLFSLTIEIYK